jgi:hypothetical protein
MKRPEVWAGVILLIIGLLGISRAWGQDTAKPDVTAQMLDRTGMVVLKVSDYDAARRLVMGTALTQGAELMDSKTQVNEKGRKHGWLRLRIGADRLPDLLPALDGAGKLYAENVQTTDHISEYEELARRVGRLQQHEGRIAGVLQSPRHMRGSDILYLQERLFRAGVDESLLSQQRLDLERSAQTSTVLIELFEPGTMPDSEVNKPSDLAQHYASAVRLAHQGITHQMARGATASAYALVYAPVWVPGLLVAFFLLRWTWKRRREWGFGMIGMLARCLSQLAVGIGWLRAAWDARQKPIHLTREPE